VTDTGCIAGCAHEERHDADEVNWIHQDFGDLVVSKVKSTHPPGILPFYKNGRLMEAKVVAS
jgi:hypothetical protein